MDASSIDRHLEKLQALQMMKKEDQAMMNMGQSQADPASGKRKEEEMKAKIIELAKRAEELRTPDAISLRINGEMNAAEHKAWKALASYKFWMFGYHAAQWVLLNRVSGQKKPNPFKEAVQLARRILKDGAPW